MPIRKGVTVTFNYAANTIYNQDIRFIYASGEVPN